jgi:predicted  nucleic acid-binding Zn-ribbon protein
MFESSEQSREALNCEIRDLSSKLEAALVELEDARKDLEHAEVEKARLVREREEEAELAAKRVSDLLADFEAASGRDPRRRAASSTSSSGVQHQVPDHLQAKFESIFRKFCVFVRSVAGACENVCTEKQSSRRESQGDDEWGDWGETASDSDPGES